jgi:hypothetical protein
MLRLVVAIAVSALFVLSAPFMGQLRAALRNAFPGRFVAIVGAAILVALAAALLSAVVRIRARRVVRYGAIVAALIVAAAYSWYSSTGSPDADAVERVHFIEYGVLTFLFYRVWKQACDLSSFVLPVLAGVIVGTLDEWLQWFIPVRVGEARDVMLNLVSILCGLTFGAAVDPPRSFTPTLLPGSRRAVAHVSASALLVFAAFASAVHLGHLVTDERWGAFRSHYTPDELQVLSADRTERWRTNPPLVLKRLSEEDQYMDEGLWHIRRRNAAWEAGDFVAAWSENGILETYFAPVLDTRSYVTPQPSRWPMPQARAAQEKSTSSTARYVSSAEPYPILAWSKVWFWTIAIALALALFAVGRRPTVE